jgi:para-nitrobenzyl esterase
MKHSSMAARALRRVALWFSLVPVVLFSAGALAAAHGVIHTEGGDLVGTTMGEMNAYLGIPYAAPPVGELRWRAPQRAHHWHGVLDAIQFAPHCPQNASPFGQASQTEDCLYLNVYTPRGAVGRDWFDWRGKPVMVWIHGGALVTGESDDYDPAALVARGVIVVTINYRLGALGFLVQSALAGGGPDPVTINYGLRDQQAALRWVRDNIGAFGGDAGNVTVFGESAGGLSTLSQIVSPRSHRLFDKAIVESGAYSLALPSVTQSEAAGAAFATAVGCSDQSAQCLRRAPLSAILANEAVGGYVPTVDGAILPSSLGAALAAGSFNQVPVMQGSNHDEWRLFVALDFDLLGAPLTDTSYAALINGTYGPALGPVVLGVYPAASYPSPDLADAAAGTDSIFACTGRIAIQALAQHVPVFAYQFSDPNAPQLFLPPVSFPYAAAHASELQYIFTLRSAIPHPALTTAQQQLSATMVDYWARFAKDSNPNQRGAPYWPQYSATSDAYQNLTPGAVMPEYDFAAEHQCAFWTPLLEAAGD